MTANRTGKSTRTPRVPPLPFLGYVFAGHRWWRYWSSRSRWNARLLKLPPNESTGETGLVLVQIDGLSRPELQRAIESGRMRFLTELLTKEGYQLKSLYSGLPSTTPAVQAELFYGSRAAVPAFSYRNGRLRRVVRMVEADAAKDVQEQVETTGDHLLKDGSACTNIYTGGAAEARFCAAASGWGELFGRASPLGIALFLLLNIGSILLASGLTLFELMRGLLAAIWGTVRGFNYWRELKFIPSRVAVGVLLREVSTIAACMDAVRGLPVIQLNYLGYDEHAHRRGPDSAFAHATLRGIDRCIERIWDAAHDPHGRMYSLWIYSDHGQERSMPYEEISTDTIDNLVRKFVPGPSEAVNRDRSAIHVPSSERARYLRRSNHYTNISTTTEERPKDVEVVAIGPLGHIYLDEHYTIEFQSSLAKYLTREARVPLVLILHNGQVVAYTPHGTYHLPEDREEVFGADHPFLGELSDDLLELLRHPDSGQLIIGGWSRDLKPVSFVGEFGAHGGVGPLETHAFALLPNYVTDDETMQVLRPSDLRKLALSHLERVPIKRDAPLVRIHTRFRLVTYNVHSCMGMDNRLSPGRIARVLAQCRPDIVALQEIDVRRVRSGHVDQAQKIAARLGMQVEFFPTIARAGELYGDALLSRFPFQVVQRAGLPSLSGRDFEPRGVLWASIKIGSKHLQVLNTHLGLNSDERRQQVDALLSEVWLDHPECRGPTVLCGDLNMSPRSKEFQRLAEHLNDVQALRGTRAQCTWISYWPRLRIDHILVSPELLVREVHTNNSRLARAASDHLPLVAELEMP